jgi:dihydroneopterin aldolase
MDKIIIEDLEIYAHHGVAAEEKKNGQMFLVTLEIGTDLEKASKSDALTDTLNYAEICDTVQQAMLEKAFDLIETAAGRVIDSLFARYTAIQEIRIILKKPWAPISHHLKYAAVELLRRRGG